MLGPIKLNCVCLRVQKLFKKSNSRRKKKKEVAYLVRVAFMFRVS